MEKKVEQKPLTLPVAIITLLCLGIAFFAIDKGSEYLSMMLGF